MHGEDALLLQGAHIVGIAFACDVGRLVFASTEDFHLQADLVVVVRIGLVHHDHADGTDVGRRCDHQFLRLTEAVISTRGDKLAGVGHRRQRDVEHLVGQLRRTEDGAARAVDDEGHALDRRVSEHLVDGLAEFGHVHAPGHLLELGQAKTEHTVGLDDCRTERRDIRLLRGVEEHIQHAVHDAVLLGVLGVVRRLDGVDEERFAAGKARG